MVSLAIIGVLAAIVIPNLWGGRDSARDAKRRADLSTLGRFMLLSCFTPAAGAGDYDLATVAQELIVKNPSYASYLGKVPQDPKTGSETESGYRYQVSAAGKCVLYANLERAEEPITLPAIATPTPGGGTGVLEAAEIGPNGTRKYFEFSN